MSETKKSEALATATTFNVALMPEADRQEFMAQMEGSEPSFIRVKMPSGGGLAFEVPGDDPDSPDMVKELVGVIVDRHPINAYWHSEYTGENNPPDCSSMDGRTGIGDPGGACAVCPYNQWGTAIDRKTGELLDGKACKNMKRIYLLQEGNLFPILLTLPPSSVKAEESYIFTRIMQKGLFANRVITKVSLKKAQNKTGITYSEAQFSLSEKLNPEQAKQLSEYSASIKVLTRRLQLTSEEYVQQQPPAAVSTASVNEDAEICAGEEGKQPGDPF